MTADQRTLLGGKLELYRVRVPDAGLGRRLRKRNQSEPAAGVRLVAVGLLIGKGSWFGS